MTSHRKGSINAKVRNVLLFKEQVALMEILKAEYSSSGLNNPDFAKRVNENPTQRALFRSDITISHVGFLIKELGIPPNQPKFKNAPDSVGDCLGAIARIQALEDQMERLTTWMRSNFDFK